MLNFVQEKKMETSVQLKSKLDSCFTLLIAVNWILYSNAYKCAVFFENLTPNRPLTWIGALPDALKKAKNQDEVEEILGENVTEESFQQLDDCSTITANARCYAIVSKAALILYRLMTSISAPKNKEH